MNSPRLSKDLWDERYAEPAWAYGTEPNDFLDEVTERLPGGTALCLADGQGRNGVHLAVCGFRVTAMDQSPVGLERAERLAAERGVPLETIEADLETYVIAPESWDVIVSIWVHMAPALRERVHADCVRGLRPGGAFVLEAYTPDQVERGTGGPSDPALTMTVEGLRRELAGLEFAILRERVRGVHEGKYHDGVSSVVQVLGIKP